MNTTPLTHAPFDRPLVLVSSTDPELSQRLNRMGIFIGTKLVRLQEEVSVQSIRLAGPYGEVVLAGGMAMKTIVHTQDGRKLPLSELHPGEQGHIEGLTGGTALAHALEVLGLISDAPVRVLRKLPPMEYITLLHTGGRIRLPEGMAAKIWGEMQGRHTQFVSARVGVPFHVKEILGGQRAIEMLRRRGVELGRSLRLEGVTNVQSLHMAVQTPIVISSADGLRLYLDAKMGKHLITSY